METLVDDHPELASEMVKLLGHELKSVKTQLRELQGQRGSSAISSVDVDAGRALAEVAELRERVRFLETENERLVNSQQQTLKQEPYDENDLLQQKEKIIQSQSESLDNSYRNMQKMKKKKERSDQDVISLREQLAAREDEAKSTANAHRRRMSELETKLALTVREKELMAEIQHLRDNYTPSSFLAGSVRAEHAEQPTADDLRPYKRYAGAFRLREEWTTLCRQRIASFGADEVLWPTMPADVIGRAVVICPAFTQKNNSRVDSGTCVWSKQSVRIGDKFEFFYQSADEWWLYMGILQCRGVSTTTLPALGQDTPAVANMMTERAVMQKNLMPPLLFNNLRRMFRDGLLQVCCVELECVGFNHPLYVQLLGEDSQPRTSHGSISPSTSAARTHAGNVKRSARESDVVEPAGRAGKRHKQGPL
ncbi:hypothetical protein BD626DRAFT_191662 [Schizophyllum amplum]|uniref:Uncharacterized protein n=1 Tax=Schizophyllum amplum TaxID=97359 RepID=A0A550CLX3_9AGAR|nr:hypothetical protein BD626DRAFT_191662 [Auriculariopsis ampla]